MESTGGHDGGLHLTDVTNASRTQLMNLETLDWDDELLEEFLDSARGTAAHRALQAKSTAPSGPRRCTAPRSRAFSAISRRPWWAKPAFAPGEAKNTYGTGCFLLMNTGGETDRLKGRPDHHRRLQDRQGKWARYALEGSIAVAGALVQWLRDNLNMIASSNEVETLARQVEDNGGVYFVPAFSGLYAPHWNERARGTILGLTRYVTRAHLARAVLEATAFQTREVLSAMGEDSSIQIPELRVDGGMVGNELLMQFQADILDVPVVRPKITETTALGAAYAAGLAVGYWRNREDLVSNWAVDKRWQPQMAENRRAALFNAWQKAVGRSLDWIE